MSTLVSPRLGVVALIFTATALTARAQTAPLQPRPDNRPASTTAHAIPVPSAHAVRRASPIVIDGKLDDAAWKDATPVTDFTQIDPDMGKPASQRTEMRFLFDDDALYIGARMYDTEGAKGVRTSLVRRDQTRKA